MMPVRAVAVILTACVGLLLLAVIVLPRWIDTPAGRAVLLQTLSELAGTRVSAEGAIEFELLPRPRFTLARLRLGGEGVLSGSVDRMDAELDLRDLLAGRLTLSRLRLVRPDLVFDGGRPQLLRLPLVLAAVPVAAAEVIGGRLIVLDGTRPPLAFEDLDLLLRPGPAEGARTIEARMRFHGERLGLELETGALRPGGQLPVDLRLSPGPAGAHGELRLTGLFGISGRFSGELQVELREPQAAVMLALLTDITGSASILPPSEALPAFLRLRLARAEHAITLQDGQLALPYGEAQFSGGLVPADSWQVSLALQIRRWRVDMLPPLASIDRIFGDWPRPRVIGTITIAADRLELAGLPVEQLRARVNLQGDAIILDELRAPLPGGGDLRADGVLRPAPAEERARLGISLTLPALHETLAAAAEATHVPEWLPHTLAAELMVRRTAAAWSLDRIELAADAARAALSGSLHPGSRPQLALAGRIERLSLDPWRAALAPNSRDAAAVLAALPFDLALSLAGDGLILGPARIEEADLDLRLAEGRLSINRLELRNLAGAHFDAAGMVDARSGDVDARIDAAVPTLARLFRLFGWPTEPLLLALGPIETRLHISRRGDLLAAELTLGAQHLSLAADVRSRGLTGRGLLSADLRVDVPSLGELARAAGMPPSLPVGSMTALAVRTAVTRSAPDVVVTTGHGRVAEAAFTLDGEWRTAAERLPEWVGRLKLDRLPPRPIIDLLYRLAQPLAAWPSLPPWEWPGRWPTAAFAEIGTTPLALDLEVLLEAEAGGFRLQTAPGRFTLAGLRWPFAEGTLMGELTLVRRDGPVVATGRLGLEDVELAVLFAESPPPLAGRLQLDLEFAGYGRSPAEILASLNGHGRLAVREGALPEIRVSAAPLAAATQPRRLFGGLGGALELRRGLLQPVGGRLQMLSERPLDLSVVIDLYAWMIEAQLSERDARLHTAQPLARLFGPLGAAEWRIEPAASLQPPASVGGPEHLFGPH
jgi:hypothetical protein